MSDMQVFYMDLTKVALAGEVKVETAVKNVLPPTVAPNSAYQQTLLRLTEATLAELKDLKSGLGWYMW